MLFINPWTWYIYNDKMPSLPPGKPEPKKDFKAVVVLMALSVLYIYGMLNLPMYMRHRFDSIDAWGVTALVLSIVYIALLYIFIRKVYKLKL